MNRIQPCRALAAPWPALTSRLVVTKTPKVDVGHVAVSYARMPRGTPYPGLSDDVCHRVDALPAHERENLAGTGSHYDGIRALKEIEARVKRAIAYDRVNGYEADNAVGGPRFTAGSSLAMNRAAKL